MPNVLLYKVMVYEDEYYEWPLQESDLRKLYCCHKLSENKIAEMFGVAGGTINYYRKKYDIQKIECWQRKCLPKTLSDSEKEVVLGYLLGDGHLGLNSKYAHLRVSQCKQQKAFVDQLHSLLCRWAAYKPVEDVYKNKKRDETYYTCRFDTVGHPVFHAMYLMCYPGGKKRITVEWLEKVGPLGLALWYQGDGSLHGETLPTFKTESFSKAEHQLLVGWFLDKFGITTYYRPIASGLNLCVKDSGKFRKLVEPYIIPEFSYKLPRERKRKGNYKYG